MSRYVQEKQLRASKFLFTIPPADVPTAKCEAYVGVPQLSVEFADTIVLGITNYSANSNSDHREFAMRRDCVAHQRKVFGKKLDLISFDHVDFLRRLSIVHFWKDMRNQY